MARYMIKKKTIFFLIPVIVGIISVGFIIAVEAQTKTFSFATTDEGFSEFLEPTCASSWVEANSGFDGADGNPTGSLKINFLKQMNPSNCDSSLNWNGSWEDLGVAPGDRASGVNGQFDYIVDNAAGGGNLVDEWAVGSLDLHASDGTNCGAFIAELEAQQATVTGSTPQTDWITVNDNGEIDIADQVASQNVCIKINAHVPDEGSGSNRDAQFNFDNIILAITSVSDPNAGIHIVTPGPSIISNGWIKLTDYESQKP